MRKVLYIFLLFLTGVVHGQIIKPNLPPPATAPRPAPVNKPTTAPKPAPAPVAKTALVEVEWTGSSTVVLKINGKEYPFSSGMVKKLYLETEKVITLSVITPSSTYESDEFLLVDPSGGTLEVWLSDDDIVAFSYESGDERAARIAAEQQAEEEAALQQAEREKQAVAAEQEGDQFVKEGNYQQAVEAYGRSLQQVNNPSVAAKNSFATLKLAAAQQQAVAAEQEGDQFVKEGNYQQAMEAYGRSLQQVNNPSVAAKNSFATLKLTEAQQQAAAEKAAAAQVLTSISSNMVYIPGGTFTMGCTSEQGSDCYSDERPAHRVTLSSYSIGKYEVTQAQWRAVMGTDPSYFKGCDNCPVEQVSWEDVQEFIRKLNSLTGKAFRLPTEAEWEYAARGGGSSRGYKFAGGNDIGSVGWYDGNSGGKTHPVGQQQPNELGLYDMSGNVWEWCSDWYGGTIAVAQRATLRAPLRALAAWIGVAVGTTTRGFAGCPTAATIPRRFATAAWAFAWSLPREISRGKRETA